ncbi:MAG: hypothetical protein NTY19_08350 [Planctomycetota bacterium]|nr:hypothetical protein [Planctomycetota bacterium]
MIGKKNSNGGELALLKSPPADSRKTAIAVQTATKPAVVPDALIICTGSEMGSAGSDFPSPQALQDTKPFLWDDDAPPVDNYVDLGQRLAECGDLYRAPQHGSGLLMASSCPLIMPKTIAKGSELAPAIADRVRIKVFKKSKPAGSMPSATHLSTMLASEAFLQQLRPLDLVVSSPMFLPGFVLTEPGYNDGGPGQRIYYVGKTATAKFTPEAMNRFLDVMVFDSESDRTNAVAAALTVMLRNFWPGAKPLVAVTSTKSHGGKDTIIAFAAGQTPLSSVSYERADWALQKNFVLLVKHNSDLGVINIENIRLKGNETVGSAFLERFLTDPQPVLFSTGTGDATRRTNNLVVAASTNFGKISEDLMNRALPIHLNPVGDVARRESPIGNPKLEYLPAHREEIASELRGLIARWKAEGQPLDDTAKHPFSGWARTIGGILMVAGFKGFLGNLRVRKTEDDPLRSGLGLLGAARPNEWLRTGEWVLVAGDLGLTKRLIPEADRDTQAGRERGLGLVFSAHRDETFEVETTDETVAVQLDKGRRRFEDGKVTTRYRFSLLSKEPIPEDGE